jgi:hypothetical protein
MRNYHDFSPGRRRLIRFETMRLVSPASGFCALGALVWGCTVYDNGLLPSNGELTDGGANMTSAGSGSGGNPTSTAGTFSASGKSNTTGGMVGDAGDTSQPTAGTGAMPGTGGDGGDGSVSGGTGGTASGSGGKGGTSGTTGSGGKGGSGGSGGSAPVAKCADHPIPLKPTWVATASSESLGNGMETDGLYNPAIHMTDGSYSERWASGKTQAGDEWIQIDFGQLVNLTTITLNVNNDTGDYPRAYAVRLTAAVDPTFKAAVIASDNGMPGNTVITFPMATGRYLTVRQTAVNTENTAWWTIAEVLAGCTDK